MSKYLNKNMTERGGGPPSTNKPGMAPNIMTNNSPSKRFISENPYQEHQTNDRKQSSMNHTDSHFEMDQHQPKVHQSTMQQFGGGSGLQQISAVPSNAASSQQNVGSSTNNSSGIPQYTGTQNQLQVGSDFKMMNLTQQQINVSKMIQTRDSEAARKALEMSKQVQSNTMSVRDQIARIQQQVQMQKDKASKAQADEQLYQAQSISIAALQNNHTQNHPQHQLQYNQQHYQQQQQQQQHQQQQQMLQRNPLSGTIQMNMQNSIAKPVQQPMGVYQNNPQMAAAQSPNITNHNQGKGTSLVQQYHQQQHQQPQQQFQQLHGHQQQVAVSSSDQYSPYPAYSNGGLSSSNHASPNLNTSVSHTRKAINQSDMQKAKPSDNHSVAGTNVVRIAKKQSSNIAYHNHLNNKPAPVTDHQSSPGVAGNSKLVKRKVPQVQNLGQQHPLVTKQQKSNMNQHSPPVPIVTNTNNQEQGQLQISKKHSQLDSNRVRPYPSQLSQNPKQSVSVRPSGMGNASRRKASMGLKEFDRMPGNGVGDQQKVEDIMPAQQSNISAEDLDDDEGRIKEIPRQSVLSNLVETSISNFENESVEDGGGQESEKGGDFSAIKSTKNMIRIEKQGSIDTGKQHNNLKSRKSQKQAAQLMMVKRKKVEPVVMNSIDAQQRESSMHKHQRKDIDSDNKSEMSDEQEQMTDSKNIRTKRKQNSIMALRRKKHGQSQDKHQRSQNNPSQISNGNHSIQVVNPTAAALNGINNSQEAIEIRGVETIEEFFRPEFAQNTQSLDDINDDSNDESDDGNATEGGAIKISGLDGQGRGSKLQKQSASSKMAPFPPFSDNENSSSDSGSQVDIGKDHNKAQFRNMGFPNMNYLDPDANGPPLQQQTYYKNFEDNQDNDVKAKRELMSNAREQMPNNTFIKLFHFLNADAGEGGAVNAGDTEEQFDEKDAFGEGMGYDRHDDHPGGPRGNKQDELQSIQYVDQNYVESSMETDNEAAMANFNREIASPAGDVRIIYNPAKNKSKSLGRVGLADQLNQFHSMNQDGEIVANPNSQLRQRKGSMLGNMGSGISDAQKNQSHGRRHRIKANSSEKLPPLLSTKNIAENSTGSRKRLIQPPAEACHQPHSEKGGNQSRQKTRAVHDSNHDSQINIFLKQALGNDLVPINFEHKGRTKQQLGEVSAKARLNGNLTTINGQQNEGHHSMYQRQMQEKHLKSSSNPSLRPNQGRSGSINVDLVAKHSISTSNQGVGAKHPKMSFMTSDHNMYHHSGVGGGGFLSPQQANPPTDQDTNLPPILKNQDNYFSRNGGINQINSGQNDRQGGAVGGEPNGPGTHHHHLSGTAANQKHFGMMHKRIENQHHYQGVFSAPGGGAQHQAPQQLQQVSNFLQSPPNLQIQQQQSPQALTTSNSPVNRNTTDVQQQFFNNSSDRRAPIKAFPTPSNAANGNMLSFAHNDSGQQLPNQKDNCNQEAATQPVGEDEMQEFVNDFERATMNEKAHDQMLSLKKIRLHHKVLAKISFNAYKFVIEFSQVIKVQQGETLFTQGHQVDQIYFVLYGALMVTIQNQNKQRVGDVVRGGNVLGEEAFFCPDPVYKETAVAHTPEVGLLIVDAAMLSGLGTDNFKGKGQNMLAYQRDFRSLFMVLKEIYGTKEAWRTRALGLLAQQLSSKQQHHNTANVRNPRR